MASCPASCRMPAPARCSRVAYMNEEALARTRETGEMWFWSRSRQELWHKGETSGNVQRLRSCATTATPTPSLALVEPAGPACHTGERTCFHNGELEPAPGEALRRARAHDRRARRRPAPAATRPSCSPIRALIGEKVREEAEEVARAARDGVRRARGEEAADVLYHLAVLLAARGLALSRRVRGAEWPSPLTWSSDALARRGARAGARAHASCRCATPSSPTARRPCRPT